MTSFTLLLKRNFVCITNSVSFSPLVNKDDFRFWDCFSENDAFFWHKICLMFRNLISGFTDESYSKIQKCFSSSKEIPVLRIYLLMS